MPTKKALLPDEERGRVRGHLQRYVSAIWPKARFRSISADNTDDIDITVDLGLGERFVRVSFEAALEVANLTAHLDTLGFEDALSALPATEQLIVATTGIHFQPLSSAFR